MKTSTLRLARRLAALVEFRDVQHEMMIDAYGAVSWLDAVDPDAFPIREIAAKRRELARKRKPVAGVKVRPPEADPIAARRLPHGPATPVGRQIDVGELAVCLMLLRSLNAVGARRLFATLQQAQPVIAIHGAIEGFEKRFHAMLQRGVIVPRHANLSIQKIDGEELLGFGISSGRNELIALHLHGPAYANASPAKVRQCLSAAMRNRWPVVITSDRPGIALPLRLRLPLGCVSLMLGVIPIALGIYSQSLALFITGAVIAGMGQGISFRAGMGAIASASPTTEKAAVTSAFFVVADPS